MCAGLFNSLSLAQLRFVDSNPGGMELVIVDVMFEENNLKKKSDSKTSNDKSN